MRFDYLFYQAFPLLVQFCPRSFFLASLFVSSASFQHRQVHLRIIKFRLSILAPFFIVFSLSLSPPLSFSLSLCFSVISFPYPSIVHRTPTPAFAGARAHRYTTSIPPTPLDNQLRSRAHPSSVYSSYLSSFSYQHLLNLIGVLNQHCGFCFDDFKINSLIDFESIISISNRFRSKPKIFCTFWNLVRFLFLFN